MLFFSCISTLYAAAYSGGGGTMSNPYRIATTADWQTLMATSADWSRHFILTANINMNGIALTPVGTNVVNFTGSFNGDGYMIRNVSMNLLGGGYCVGLFGYVSGGQIINLRLISSNIQGGSCVGGLVGYNNGYISCCYTTAAVSGSVEVGNLVGHNFKGSITSCFTAGTVTGGGSVGGLVGYNSRSTITTSYAKAAVNGSGYVGGLVGFNDASSILSCYSAGAVSGSEYVGGLVGISYISPCENCFWDTQASGQTISAEGTGKTTLEMQTLSTFTDAGWDFSTTDGDPADWKMSDSDYPSLVWESYCGDAEHPYPLMDFNQDCYVDLADFALFAAHWLECTAPKCN